MRLRRYGEAALALASLLSMSPPADGCRAEVEHLSTRIVGRRFETDLRVGHDAGPGVRAWVYFEYWIHFRTVDGGRSVERGVFRRRIPGESATYTRQDLSLTEPAAVDSVEVGEQKCMDPRGPGGGHAHRPKGAPEEHPPRGRGRSAMKR